MKLLKSIALAAISLPIGACCCGGKKVAGDGGSQVTASTSIAKMADPERVKSVKKIAVASVFAECDIKNETQKGALGAASAISGLKNQEMLRSPATLDKAAPAFASEIAKATGWTVIPLEEMTSNPAYAEKTFPADLREQVKITRKALGCAGGNYRVLTVDYPDRAGELATALGVDAVLLAQFQLIIKYDEMGTDATVAMWSNGHLNLVGQDGQVLFKDRMTTRSDNTIPTKLGNIDWTQVPSLGPSALQNAAKKFAADLQKQGVPLTPAYGSSPAPSASPKPSPAPSPAPSK